jgi:hypothetical protein
MASEPNWAMPKRFGTSITPRIKMSLSAFQHALCDLVASPQTCVLAREHPEKVFDKYDLTSLELERLIDLIHQRGMSTNCTLYRVNRLTPIYTLLPNTSFLLGDDLVKWADYFWTSHRTDSQFKSEVEAFGEFLKQKIQSGTIQNDFIEEILDFELAINSLRFLPKKQILNKLVRSSIDGSPLKIRLNPLVKIVLFTHEPILLLSLLASVRLPPIDLPTDEYYLLIDATNQGLAIKKIDPYLGRLLKQIDLYEAPQLLPIDLEALTSSSLVVERIVA